MRFVGNVLWLVLAGFWLAIAYVIAGIVNCVTIIGIPFGIQSFKLAGYALWPFGRTVVQRPDRDAGIGCLANGSGSSSVGWSWRWATWSSGWSSASPSSASRSGWRRSRWPAWRSHRSARKWSGPTNSIRATPCSSPARSHSVGADYDVVVIGSGFGGSVTACG